MSIKSSISKIGSQMTGANMASQMGKTGQMGQMGQTGQSSQDQQITQKVNSGQTLDTQEIAYGLKKGVLTNELTQKGLQNGSITQEALQQAQQQLSQSSTGQTQQTQGVGTNNISNQLQNRNFMEQSSKTLRSVQRK